MKIYLARGLWFGVGFVLDREGFMVWIPFLALEVGKHAGMGWS